MLATPQTQPALEHVLKAAAARLVLAMAQHSFRDFWSPEVASALQGLFATAENPPAHVPPRQSEVARRMTPASVSGQMLSYDSVSLAPSEGGPASWATYEGKPQGFDRQSWISTDSSASVQDHGAAICGGV